MADTTSSYLRKAEKKMAKLKKQLKRADLDYTIQASMSSLNPGEIHFAAQLTAPANGLAPVTFVTNTGAELIEQIDAAIKDIDYTAVEKAYHAAQVEACKNTIKFHQEKIAELDETPLGDVLGDNPAPTDEAPAESKDA